MFMPSLAATLLALPGLAAAIDLGAIGPVYPIGEPHLLDFIRQRLREKESNGELRKLEELARKRATETVSLPPPVAGIRAAEMARTFYFDPTYTLDRNIVDDKGTLLFAAGTSKNPLEIVPLSKHLLFFDARDRQQVARARALITYYQGRVKPILVGGSYLDLMRSWRTPVYYDQQGILTRRLGITRVPAIVSQEGMRLRIDELVQP
ncbi:MAG: type-F conjugative transfer system protein TraW [Pseudomonadota bacterium]